MLALFRLLRNLVSFATFPLWGLAARFRARRTAWVSLRLHGELDMLEAPPFPWAQRWISRVRRPAVAVSTVRRLVESIRGNPRVQGLFIQVDGLGGGWAVREALRSELVSLRRAGKRVVVFLPEGGDQGSLALAGSADTVWLTPPAQLSWLGPSARRTYVKPLLARLGIEVDVLARGTYKTAAESLSRSAMSEPEREQLSAIVSTLLDALTEALAGRPRLDSASVRRLFEQGIFDASEAVERGLVDGLKYEDEVRLALGFGERRGPLPASRYLAGSRPVWQPLFPKPKVAILRLEGAIGVSGGGIALGPTTAVLRKLADDPRVAGVLLYVDSPGGSALVSDLLHREVARLAAKKPVVAWLSNIAASGGYYLAVAAPTIVAGATTLTGSIGVISVRPVVATLLEGLGVRREVVKQTERADLHEVSRALTEAERATLEQKTGRFYERFIEVVAEGRRLPREVVESLAQGRVWSGRDAKLHGLVDELGAYAEARERLDVALSERGVVAEREPSVVVPPLRRGASSALLRGALSSLEGWGLARQDLSAARDLITLAAGRHRDLYYALPGI